MGCCNYIGGVVGLLIAIGYYYYFINSGGNADDKRKLFPYLTIIINILVLALMLWTVGIWGIFLSVILVPLALLISLVLIRVTKFCDGCGSGAPSYVSFRKVACCPKCGKQFAASKVWSSWLYCSRKKEQKNNLRQIPVPAIAYLCGCGAPVAKLL